MYTETSKLIKYFDLVFRKKEEALSLTDSNWDFLFSSRIYYYDKPDILIENNNTLYAFEHFGFNASEPILKKDRHHGDSFSYINDCLNKNIEFKNKVEDVDINVSLKHYVDNFLYNFDKKCKKFDSYLINIKKFERFAKMDIKFGFWCEDNMPFGTYYTDNVQKIHIVPVMIREIFNKIKQTEFLDYCIFTTESPKRMPTIYLAEKRKLRENIIVKVNEESFYIHKLKNITNVIQYKR